MSNWTDENLRPKFYPISPKTFATLRMNTNPDKLWKQLFATSFLPVLEPDKAEIVDLDHLQPLGDRVKDKLYPILRQLDGEVVGQGVPVTVRYLHSLVDRSKWDTICSDHPFPLVLSEIGFAFCLLLQSRSGRLCLLHSRLSCARNNTTTHSYSFWGLFSP